MRSSVFLVVLRAVFVGTDSSSSLEATALLLHRRSMVGSTVDPSDGSHRWPNSSIVVGWPNSSSAVASA